MPQGPIPTAIANKVGGGYGLPNMDKQSALWQSARHPKYYLPAYNGTSYFSSVVGGTTTVGLATTYTGLCVSNPAGSTVNLVIQRVQGAFVVNSTAITVVGLIRGYAAGGVTAHTTPGTVNPCNTGVAGSAGQALADAACTLVGTPIWAGWLAAVASAAVAGSFFNVDFDGEQIIQPGGYLAIGTNVVSGTNGFNAYISWDEVPL